MDTIFALATARGKAGVAVVRVSGPEAFAAGTALCGALPAPRHSALRRLTDPAGALIDEALVLCFEAGHSFTGEPVVELQMHGSTSVVSYVLSLLGDMPGLRHAEAGEFTRRALENGRLDLTQVEGLADLIDAETEMQRRQAVRVMSGELAQRAEAWRANLLRAAALLEATIDFADEEVPEDVTPEVVDLVSRTLTELRRDERGVKIAERIRHGFEVAIVGAPNVGKSTLLNALAGRDAAITSEIAGTTRDVIEVRMEVDGFPVTFLDTAGLRETDDVVEAIGVARARDRARQADLRVFLAAETDVETSLWQEGDIRFTPKADLVKDEPQSISGRTGQGIDSLLRHLSTVFADRIVGSGLAIRERHRVALASAADALDAALPLIAQGPVTYDIAAEELHRGIRALHMLIGRVDVETVLGEIFSSFCVGK
ncbi:tRNA uridine-5-carboxymethylaminomethyl(34) synthesis GTPase MnmE [Mesobacterium pallidum]|uniref:tRNA uridine-5-carboxymethylaminomethyl(34) synthesis GTPase MnmE n=1 Tax=Mesobacterium pallidum TaxID=2872037 RepID=UPI001EE258FC|nr:tRNA uridine-5-carboxymethylaminomethyl(34) synthesis GTPase MnmE [Mesobacterium pallidum]